MTILHKDHLYIILQEAVTGWGNPSHVGNPMWWCHHSYQTKNINPQSNCDVTDAIKKGQGVSLSQSRENCYAKRIFPYLLNCRTD